MIHGKLEIFSLMFSQISRTPDFERSFRVKRCGLYAGVYGTDFFKALERKKLNIPQPSELPVDDVNYQDWRPVIPYYFVGDDAFSLSENLMKPYPNRGQTEEQRILNYRFSRARRVSENAFGILSSKFRVFLSTLCVKPENATIT